MGRYELIRAAIDGLGGGQFQVLAQRYITARYGYQHPHYLGTKAGTEETTRGTPDAFWKTSSGGFVFVECGHVTSGKSAAKEKVKSDIQSCLDYEAQSAAAVTAEKIIICYGYSRFEPADIDELESLDCRVVLVGPDQIAEDIYRDYPSLAKDYLGLGFDSNQVLEPSAFVGQIENDAYAPSIKGDLIGRDDELDDLLELIESTSAIVVSGKSGCGKTKLAFEACRDYARRSNVSFFVIRSRHRAIYEDLRTYFSPNKDYIVLVDDANDLSGLDDLVDYVQEHGNVKVLLTVRNYVAEAVCKTVGRIGDYRKYELGQLEYDDIVRMARSQLDASHIGLAELIVEKARGNLRLVFLAAQSINEQGVSVIRSMKHLLEICYGGKLESLSNNERKAAGIASVMGAHRTEGNDQLSRYEQLAGISHEAYKTACVSLHEKELLDCLHGIAAVHFEEQNIRDYLIYDAICVSRWIALADIDQLTQGDYRMKQILNILLDVFGDDGTSSEVQRQLEELWDAASPDRRWSLTQEFGPLFGYRALQMTAERIGGMGEVEFVWSEDCFGSHSRSGFYERRELAALETFFGTVFSGYAEDVLLSIVERRLASSSDLRRSFYELACSLKVARKGDGFGEIEGLARKLEVWCDDEPCRVFCFLAFVEGVMDDQAIHARYSTYLDSYELEQAVIVGPGMLDLRRVCVRALRGWLGIPMMRKPIRDVLLGYRPGWGGFARRDTSLETFKLLQEEFVPFYNAESVSDYEKLLDFAYIAERCGLEAESVKEKLCEGRSSEIIIMMLESDHRLDDRDQVMEELGLSLRTGEYDDLFQFLTGLGFGPHDGWWVSYSLKMMLQKLSDTDPARFEQVCLSYVSNGMHPDVAGQVVVHFMYGKLGAGGTRDWCKAHAANLLEVWLHHCNVEAIIAGAAGEVAEYVLDEFESVDRPLHFEYICRCGIQRGGFMSKYYEKVIAWSERHGSFPDWTLLYDPRDGESLLCKLAKEPENVYAIEDALIKMLEWQADKYHESGLVGGLIKVDQSFAVRLAREATVLGAINALGAVGATMKGMDAGDASFADMAHAIFGADVGSEYYGRQRSMLRFLNTVICDENRASVLGWMAQEAVCDSEFGTFILEVACALDNEPRKQFVLEACRNGLAASELSGVCCGMSFKGESWSGSYVPVLRQKISFLEDVEHELDGFEFTEYKLEIARLKEAIERRIYAVEEDEFVRG